MAISGWKYLFASVCVFSAAIVAAAYAPAISQQARPSSYMITAEQGSFVWRVNVTDGSVSFCQRELAVSNNPNFISKSKPYCSSASSAAAH